MGRASRKRNENRKNRVERTSLASAVSVTMAVFTTPREGATGYEAEVALTKPAVLYGDRVDLYSMTALTHLGTAVSIESSSLTDIVDLALLAGKVDPSIDADEIRHVVDQVEALGRMPNAPKSVRRMRRELHEQLKNAKSRMLESIENQFIAEGGGPLLDAIAADLLRVSPLVQDPPPDGDLNAAIVSAFLDRLADVMTGRESAYPLMTAKVHGLLDAAVREGRIRVAESTRNRTKDAGLATGLIDRLPTFPQADMSEILDIRTALSEPLIRFRAEISGLSASIASAPGSEDFAVEVEDAWVGSVAPAILEIEELASEDKYLRRLMRTPSGTAAAAGTVAGSAAGLGIAIGAGDQLLEVAAASPLIGLGTALATIAGTAAVQAWHEVAQQSAARRKMQFFFLYDTNMRLEQGSAR